LLISHKNIYEQIYSVQSLISIEKCSFSHCKVKEQFVGAVFATSNLKVSSSYFFTCEAFNGGSIYQAGNAFCQIFYSIFHQSNAQFKDAAIDFHESQNIFVKYICAFNCSSQVQGVISNNFGDHFQSCFSNITFCQSYDFGTVFFLATGSAILKFSFYSNCATTLEFGGI
jgi:hypothetical protein